MCVCVCHPRLVQWVYPTRGYVQQTPVVDAAGTAYLGAIQNIVYTPSLRVADCFTLTPCSVYSVFSLSEPCVCLR